VKFFSQILMYVLFMILWQW